MSELLDDKTATKPVTDTKTGRTFAGMHEIRPGVFVATRSTSIFISTGKQSNDKDATLSEDLPKRKAG